MTEREADDTEIGHTSGEFDVALWGYDRRQVERCLRHLSERLTEADAELARVHQLRTQLYEAQWELDQLRRDAQQRSAWSDRLAEVMATAEQLRARAEQDAAAARSEVREDGDPAEGGSAGQGRRAKHRRKGAARSGASAR